MELKEFQIEAVNKAVTNIYELLETSNRRAAKGDDSPAHFVLQSCTGSGKTVMLAEILRELKERDLSEQYVFVWAAPNKLHAQSQKKLAKLLADTEYNLIDIESLESGALQENTIIFTNWEKVFKRATKDDEEKGVKKGDFNNVVVKRGETGRNIQDILDATREAGLKTIIIVDESHQTFYGPNSQLLVHDVIKPSLVIEASATPKYESSDNDTEKYRRIKVMTDDVIDSGLIKKQILINSNIESIAEELNRDAITTAVMAGLRKRAELEKEYEKLGLKINPLMAIQLPTENKEELSELDSKVRSIVEEILSNKGYEYYNKNLAIWLSEEKENLDNITDNNNMVDVLIFKQAIALGWDCPRAQVLVMLREIKNEAFQIQTVGRVLRMPEAKHYGNEILDSAYVYTNSGKTIKIDPDDTDAKNLIKYKKSFLRPGANIVLPESVYVHRVDYGDLKANFKKVLEGELDLAFRTGDPDSEKTRLEKIDDKLEIYPEELNTPVISDVVIKNIDDVTEQNEVKTINLSMDNPNIERVFRDVLRGYCGRFKSFARSETKIVGTLKPWFKKAGIEWETVQRIFTCSEHNQRIISDIFDRAIDQYDKINREEMFERRQRQDQYFDFSIPQVEEFSDKYIEVGMTKCAVLPFFRKVGAPTTTEIPFEEALDKSSEVEWWYKNGEKMEKYFAVKYFELGEDAKSYGKAFYPDYIVKFKDGRIGIFDTKSGWTADDKNAGQKANALQKYITDHKDLNLFGGIMNVANGLFYLNQSSEYEFGDGKTGQWKLFEL